MWTERQTKLLHDQRLPKCLLPGTVHFSRSISCCRARSRNSCKSITECAVRVSSVCTARILSIQMLAWKGESLKVPKLKSKADTTAYSTRPTGSSTNQHTIKNWLRDIEISEPKSMSCPKKGTLIFFSKKQGVRGTADFHDRSCGLSLYKVSAVVLPRSRIRHTSFWFQK